MGSEVKFRAKVLKSKNWIYRQPFHIRGTWYMYNSLWDMVPIEHRTIGQETGIKDKNGREIYAGDIVARRYRNFNPFNIHDFKGVVEYHEGTFFIINPNDTNECAFLFTEIEENEVIGNIYDNPELLEEGENG